MTTLQLLDLYILLLNNYLILSRLSCRLCQYKSKAFLRSYLVPEIIFWFKQDAVLWNHFRLVVFQIVKKICFFYKTTLQEQSRKYYRNLSKEEKEKKENMRRIDIRICLPRKRKQEKISKTSLSSMKK